LELARTYLKKHTAGDSLIKAEPEKDLKYIVVLPAYLETRLEEGLVSLFEAISPSQVVEIIIIINWPDDESPENIELSHTIFSSVKEWAKQHSSKGKQFHVAEAGFIPRKKAGVGFARKNGMDEAVRRFLRAGQEDGVIISFDADTKCDPDYFVSIEEHFRLNPNTDGCSIYFEHPLEGTDHPEKVYTAITQYELHMRCYLHAIRYSGFPNAFYTVGSALAVRATSYCRQGGMNARQAGEDFYFLQKFFDLGNFTELRNTRVCPSPRPSLRVPFGTGKTMVQLLESGQGMKSYNPAIYDILKDFFALVPAMYNVKADIENPVLSQLHPCILQFLDECGFDYELRNIIENSGSLEAFTKRFYRYFNMFRILKFVKYARNIFPDLPVSDCARVILAKTENIPASEMTEKEQLLKFRKADR